MARLFIDGWEHGDVAALWTFNSGCSINAWTGRTGAYGVSVSGLSYIYKNLPSSYTEVYGAMKWMPTGSSRAVCGLRKDGTDIFKLYWNASLKIEAKIGGSIVGTAPDAHSSGQVGLLEFYFKIADSGGRVVVKLDGITIIDYTGDTKPGADSDVNRFYLGDGGWCASFFDDVVLDDADWIGDTRIQKLQISGAGTTSEWDASAGNPEDCIDEIPYSDSDFVSTNVVNQSLTCACADMTGDIVSIKCLQLHGRMAYEGAPTPTKQKLAIRVNGSEYYGDDKSPALSFSVVSKLWELNPDDAAAWEEADINAIEIGVRSVT